MIKVGIIGCGKITEVRHAPEYMENPNCELAAFYDLVPGRAEEFARRFGGRAYGSVDELLASGVCRECVHGQHLHAAMAIQALRAGKHVLCEKPMATTPGRL